ncbi:MAG: hypothetical protein JOY69_03100 [Candidatus Eremiobacteraeota bacterium]|nr:hypothetical protein [Candidatus Eremiobacteraeota bacterium]
MRLLALLLAVAVPSPSPSPSSTALPLKTIITVVSSPYCNALAQHFNNAYVPMNANDRLFDTVNVQLLQMNDMFKGPDYIDQYVQLRTKMIKESGVLMASLKPIHEQIDQLRQSADLSQDPDAVKQMRDAAAQLQDAYLHQFQLSTDLQSLAQAMIDYNVWDKKHPINGWTEEEQSLPADEKNVKVYLHFDKQRTSIDTAESRAVDAAYAIAQTKCTK